MCVCGCCTRKGITARASSSHAGTLFATLIQSIDSFLFVANFGSKKKDCKKCTMPSLSVFIMHPNAIEWGKNRVMLNLSYQWVGIILSTAGAATAIDIVVMFHVCVCACVSCAALHSYWGWYIIICIYLIPSSHFSRIVSPMCSNVALSLTLQHTFVIFGVFWRRPKNVQWQQRTTIERLVTLTACYTTHNNPY